VRLELQNKGINPTYHDKISRFGVRLVDLWDELTPQQWVEKSLQGWENFPKEPKGFIEF
jgi:adenylosuccinate synthase